MQKMSPFSFHFPLYSGALVIYNQVIIFSHTTEQDRKKATGKEKIKPILKLAKMTLFQKQNPDFHLKQSSLSLESTAGFILTSAGQYHCQKSCDATANVQNDERASSSN